MDKNIKIAFVIIGIVSAISLVLAGMNTLKLYDTEWVCIAQECVEYATEDDWVNQNCKLQGNEMVCEFNFQGQNFRVPLSGINTSNMISCKEYTCSSKVLITYGR